MKVKVNMFPISTIANLRNACESDRVADDPRDPTGYDYDKIQCDLCDLENADRESKIDISEQTMEWIMQELCWCADEYYNNNNNK